MSKSTAPVTAATLRAYFQDEAKGAARVAALPEDARKSVLPGARGKVNPAAIKAFNSKRRQDKRYVVGVSRNAAVAAKAEVESRRQALRDAGIEVKSRGRLPKMVLVTDKA